MVGVSPKGFWNLFESWIFGRLASAKKHARRPPQPRDNGGYLSNILRTISFRLEERLNLVSSVLSRTYQISLPELARSLWHHVRYLLVSLEGFEASKISCVHATSRKDTLKHFPAVPAPESLY